MKYYGAAYYPEIFPKKDWENDLRLLKEAGMNVIRIGESAWGLTEGEEGIFNFEWLHEVLNICRKQGIFVIMGTPTYLPPPWLTEKYPDIIPETNDGRKKQLGGRHHYCLHSPSFIQSTKRIVEGMAREFCEHPTIIGWQIHNEFGLGGHCFCSYCKKAWGQWLKMKYKIIEELNNQWRNDCWDRCYTSFEQVPFPEPDPHEGTHTLAIILAHHRFRSDAFKAYQRVQVNILNKYKGDRWLTHNAMGLDLFYDHYDLYETLDVAGFDNYPAIHEGWEGAALSHDLNRSIKKRSHWVLEQICGSIGGGEVAWSGHPRPDELKRWTLHAYAHGAEGVCYWLWRSKPGGNWPYWQGVLSLSGEKTVSYKELKETGKVIKKLREKEGHFPSASNYQQSEVVFILDYDNLWTAEKNKGHPDFKTNDAIINLYRPFVEKGISVDVKSSKHDLSGYKIAVLPIMSMLTNERSAALEKFVQEGGTLIVGPRAARYTSEGTQQLKWPRFITEVCGIKVAGYDVLVNGYENSVAGKHIKAKANFWCDFIELNTAEAIAYYQEDFYKSNPSITKNVYGNGRCYYSGTYLDSEGSRELCNLIINDSDIESEWDVPCGCEVVKRNGLTFVFNHTNFSQTIKLPTVQLDIISGLTEDGFFSMMPNETKAFTGG